MAEAIYTVKELVAIGPYSQAIKAGDIMYVSGEISVDPASGEVANGIEKQTHQVLKNLQAILTEAKADFSEVVKFTIYLKSMDDFAVVNEIYGSYLKKPYPARATVEVSRLPKDVIVEMDVVVYPKQ